MRGEMSLNSTHPVLLSGLWRVFTGRKDSAEGALSVSDALKVFTIRTLVAAKHTDVNKEIIKSIVTQRSSRFLSTDFIL